MDNSRQTEPEDSGLADELKSGTKAPPELSNTGFYVGFESGYEAGSRDAFRACVYGVVIASTFVLVTRLFRLE